MLKHKIFTGNNPNVKKYVFDYGDAIAEAVLYKYPTYEKRTVLCVSVQSGCPVGCTFCGTGNKFIRNLKSHEILGQIYDVFQDIDIEPERIEKLQIMFMSMGEPLLNYNEVEKTIRSLSKSSFKKADLLISTIAPDRPSELSSFLWLSEHYSKIGLQFSIHKSTDEGRDELIPYRKKLPLLEIRNYGIQWWHRTKRKPYLNYCIDGTNHTVEDFERLRAMFPPNVFCFTFSVVCSSEAGGFEYRNLEMIHRFENLFVSDGYDTRVFDPAGQDDIGGGCGQLWYVQEWMKEKEAC